MAKSGTSPAAGDVDPFRKTRSILALDVDNVCVAPAPAAHSILLLLVPVFPVIVLGDARLLVFRRHLEVLFSRQLFPRRVGRAVLDGGVPVAKVAKVMDIARTKERSGRKGMNRCISPLGNKVG